MRQQRSQIIIFFHHALFISLLFLNNCGSIKTQESCPSGWNLFEDQNLTTCFKVGEDSRPWEDARAICKWDGGDLVKIVNANMSDYIVGLLNDTGNYWIGLWDPDLDGIFQWVDEEELTQDDYQNWDQSEPETDNSDAYCVELDPYQWENEKCHLSNEYICEQSLDSGTSEIRVYCPTGWYGSEASDTCIRGYTDGKTWYEAREACQEQGGDLVKIDDEEMNYFVAAYLLTLLDEPEDFFIGLRNIQDDLTYRWLDETEEADYTHWGESEPDNFDDENCAVIAEDGLTDWGDVNCGKACPYICEQPPSSSVSSSPNSPEEEVTTAEQSVTTGTASDELSTPEQPTTATEAGLVTQSQSTTTREEESSTREQTTTPTETETSATTTPTEAEMSTLKEMTTAQLPPTATAKAGTTTATKSSMTTGSTSEKTSTTTEAAASTKSSGEETSTVKQISTPAETDLSTLKQTTRSEVETSVTTRSGAVTTSVTEPGVIAPIAGSQGLSTIALTGLVVGAILVILVASVLALWYYRRTQRAKREEDNYALVNESSQSHNDLEEGSQEVPGNLQFSNFTYNLEEDPVETEDEMDDIMD